MKEGVRLKIDVHNIGCFRGGRHVLAGVSFTLEGGKAVKLRGPNGVGKSTLLRVLAGLVPFQTGAIDWFDGDGSLIDPDVRMSRLHYVGHLDAIKPGFTVVENLVFWSRFYGGGGDVTNALDAVKLGRLGDVPGQFLSAGQKRRLALARLLVAPRPVWLLDEPTVALDTDGVALFCDLMNAHVTNGGILLASTHIEMGIDNALELRLGMAEAAS